MKYIFHVVFIVIVLLVSILLTFLASNKLNLVPKQKNDSLCDSNLRFSTFTRLPHYLESRFTCTNNLLAKQTAIPHSAPYVVSIQQWSPEMGWVHQFAGTIIDKHWILTAAHCLRDVRNLGSKFLLVAGCHDIRLLDEGQNTQYRDIDSYKSHELYTGDMNPYDIAVIYTKKPLNYNAIVKAANLPNEDSIPEGVGTLYGWGNISMTNEEVFPDKLQEATMPLIDLESCEEKMISPYTQLNETNICTGPLIGGLSICNGDSGGPLMQDDTIIGIASWGKTPCGQHNAASVFVRVSAFIKWIKGVRMDN